MKVSVLKSALRSESRNDRSLGIQTYGENNDYPQRCEEIINISGTGSSCLGIYSKFINGQGFEDANFYKSKLNGKGQTTDYMLSRIANDYALYGGFAIHVNYNALYQIVEVQHVPFETVRFEKLNDNGNFNRLATHPDWGRRYQALRRFSKDDIKWFDFYNPDPHEIEKQVNAAESWEKWNGQIFYFSSKGEKTYPLTVYDAVLTDMSTEEGISNVKYRNARNNFFPAGMLIDKKSKSQTDRQEDEVEKLLLEAQTDEKACKIIKVEIEDEVEKPEFVPFETKNYDKEFSYTEKSIQQNIGRRFNQPPILRAEDVGGNFGAELITNAYNYYNSITETERLNIERVFAEIFSRYSAKINLSGNYSIIPLKYNYADVNNS